jgi:hypothetical protein
MDDSWPSSRPYVLGSLAMWGLFLVTIFLLSWASGPGRWPLAALWSVALLHAASVAGQFFAAYRLIARQDEYIRGITAKRMIAASGLTITLAVLFGVARQFLGAPDMPIWLIYPLFWGAFGIVTPLIRDTRP